MSEQPWFFGWQCSPKLVRDFYLCCAAEEQGETIHGVSQGVQEYCGRAGNEAWLSQVLDYRKVIKSWNCDLPSWFISFHAAAQSHLDQGMRTDFRYELLLLYSEWLRASWKSMASMNNCSQHLKPLLSPRWKELSYGWLVLLFLKLYNPHWTQCLSSLG